MKKGVLKAVIAAFSNIRNIMFPESLWTILQNQEFTLNLQGNCDQLVLAAYFLKRDDKKIRIPNYFELWVTKYDEFEFFTHFRMGKNTFNFLVAKIAQLNSHSNIPPHYGGFEPVNLEKAILVLIWYLAKGDTYASIADRFNMGVSTAHGIIKKYLENVVALRLEFIKWPSREEAINIAHDFKEMSGYPGVIGAIDGTHFPCVVPKEEHDSYQNRKLQHSIIMQAICTSNRVITDIFVGYPGSCNDGRVLHESPLFRKVETKGPQELFFENYHLIGDKAYVCYEWLMTPYRDTGRLTRTQKKHNYMLSKARVVIEHVFGLLKGRWRILKFVNVYKVKKVVDIIVACCVLHNICFLNEDIFTMDFENMEDDPSSASLLRDNKKGTLKRDNIMNKL